MGAFTSLSQDSKAPAAALGKLLQRSLRAQTSHRVVQQNGPPLHPSLPGAILCWAHGGLVLTQCPQVSERGHQQAWGVLHWCVVVATGPGIPAVTCLEF